jgi:hypothetical protein
VEGFDRVPDTVVIRRPQGGKRRPEEATGTRSHEMTRYLISFDEGAMTFPEEEMPHVAEAAHKVVQEAKNTGVWVFGGGVVVRARASWPPTGRSPMARTRRPRRSSADSRSLTCPHTRRRWSGLPRSPSPAGVHKRLRELLPDPNV